MDYIIMHYLIKKLN